MGKDFVIAVDSSFAFTHCYFWSRNCFNFAELWYFVTVDADAWYQGKTFANE